MADEPSHEERDVSQTDGRLGKEFELPKLGLGLTRFRGPIRVKRSGSVKGVKDGQERQALLA